ncbi:MAG: transposase [Cenarchaeum sp. SB0661_bin_35]|nr:transposase [Cenarchaeum sp. SB0662_bin_33]MYC79506.1 transposase [Cenarchaeum sp. SB0661_bin_35]MYD59261.1 transposase [Cenarchaeum sp. SB0678_bin_8]
MDKQSSTRNDSKKPGGDLSLEELFEMFPDEDTARELFEGNIWPDGCRCPRCGYMYSQTPRDSLFLLRVQDIL